MIQGITPYNTITSIALFLGYSLGIILLFKQSTKQRANLFLGIIIIHITTFYLPGYLWGARILEYFPHTVDLGLYFSMALGPNVYLYVRATTEKDFQIRLSDAWHYVPLLLDLAFSYPQITASGSYKVKLLKAFLLEGTYDLTLFHTFVKALHVVVYYFLSVRLVYYYQNHLKNTVSRIDNVFHRWLLFFSSVLLLMFFLIILVGFTGYRIVPMLLYIFGVFTFLIAVYLAMLIMPTIFHRFPHQIETATLSHSSPSHEREKYEHSKLADAQKEAFLQKLQQYMQTDKPYREPDLTIRQLADRLNIPTNYLSQIINEKLSLNFIDFINQQRVAAAKNLLIDAAYEHYTVQAVAEEAGFNSKSAFYVAFKKYAGVTPGKYRKSLKFS